MKSNPILALLSAIVALALVGGCSQSEPSAPITTMSFNIRYGLAKDGDNHWDKRKPLVFDVFADHAPEIVGLQEALDFQIDAILEAHPQYDYVGIGREPDDTGEHTAILFLKDAYEVLQENTFWLSDTPETPSTSWGNQLLRIYTYALLQRRSDGLQFYVYNTHFDHRSEPSRQQSARFLRDRIVNRTHTDAPFVLMGDFNAGEDSVPIKTLLGESGDAPMVDTFRVLHPDAVDVGTGTRWIGKVDGNKIDYIFVATDTEVLEAEIVHDNDNGRYPSDHYPVKATIRF